MTDVTVRVTPHLLEAFADAWNRHDADALMSFMTLDCVFESSAGPDVCGTRHQGAEAVRTGYVQVWTTEVSRIMPSRPTWLDVVPAEVHHRTRSLINNRHSR